MKIIIIGTIISFLAIVGVIVFNVINGDNPIGTEQEEVGETEEKGESILDKLFGNSGESNDYSESEGSSILSKLFGGGSSGGGETESESSGDSILSKLFGGSSSSGGSDSYDSGDSILSKLFGGGGSSSNNQNEEEVGVEKESSDSLAPRRFNASPRGELSYSTKKTNISLDTNEIAVCRYDTNKGVRYDAMKAFSSTASTHHSTEITGLSEGQEYTYYIKCQDLDMNKNETDFIISFEVAKPKDETAPKRSNAYPFEQVFSSETEEVVIGISTDEEATCRYDNESGTSYSSMPYYLSPYDDTKRYHTAKINVESGKNYEFFIRCRDNTGNVNLGDVLISFSVSY